MHGLVVVWKEGRALFDEDERAELGLIVFQEELAVFEFNLGMTPRDRNVVNSQVTFVAAPELENVFLCAWPDNINDPTVVLLLAQTLKHEVITDWLLILNEVVSAAACLEHQRVGILADLALERLPEERREIWARFCLTLDFEPAAQALQVNETH